MTHKYLNCEKNEPDSTTKLANSPILYVGQYDMKSRLYARPTPTTGKGFNNPFLSQKQNPKGKPFDEKRVIMMVREKKVKYIT